MAERQGFEPWEHLRVQWFSRPPRSSTPAPLREHVFQVVAEGMKHSRSTGRSQVDV